MDKEILAYPKHGVGNAPWVDRCICTPLPTPVITCEGN